MVEFVSANPTGPLHVGHGRGAAVGDAIATLLDAQGFARPPRVLLQRRRRADRESRAVGAGARPRSARASRAVSRGRLPRRVHPRDRARRTSPRIRTITRPTISTRSGASRSRHCAASRTPISPHSASASTTIISNRRSTPTAGSTARSSSADRRGQDLRAGRRAVAQDHRLRRRQGPRDAEVGRKLHLFRSRHRLPRHQVGARLHARDQPSRAPITTARSSRVRAGLQALDIGIPPGYPDYVLHQMVLVMRGGEEVKLSKRAGRRRHGARADRRSRPRRGAFLLPAAQVRFAADVRHRSRALAERGKSGLLRAVRARARLQRARQGGDRRRRRAAAALRDADLSPLQSPYEQALLRRLADFPDELAIAARELAPHLVTFYLKELAAEFHSYYNAEQFLVDDVALRKARLALVVAVGQVVRNGLAMLGVSAPVGCEGSTGPRRQGSMNSHRPEPDSRPPVAPIDARRRRARHFRRPDPRPGDRRRGRVSISAASGSHRRCRCPERPRMPRAPARPTCRPSRGAPDKPRFDFYKILPGAEEPRIGAERKAADKAIERPGDKTAPDAVAKAARRPRDQARRSHVAAGRRVRQRNRTPRASRRVSRSPAGKRRSSRRRCPTRACAIACASVHTTTPTNSIASKPSSARAASTPR